MGHLTTGSRQDQHPEKNHSEVWKMSRCYFPVGKRGAGTPGSRNCSYKGSEKGRHTGSGEMEGNIRPDQGRP